jgi:hypothetical protein
LKYVQKFSQDALAVLNTSINVAMIDLFKSFDQSLHAKKSKMKNTHKIPRELRYFLKTCKERKLYQSEEQYEKAFEKNAKKYEEKRQRTLTQREKKEVLKKTKEDNNKNEGDIEEEEKENQVDEGLEDKKE